MARCTHPQTRGITVIEVLIGAVILSTVTIFVLLSLNLYFTKADLVHQRAAAQYLVNEGQEFARFVRDENWNTIDALTLGTWYSFTVTPTTVSIGAAPEVIDGTYTRQIRVRRAYRDTNDDLTTEALGTNDPESRWVDVQVTWGANSVLTTALLTNIFEI